MMSMKAIFCRALESIRENVVLWAFTCAIFVIVYKAGPLLERVLGRDLHTVFEIISWIVGFIVQIALISLSLGFTRQERPRLGAFFCPVSTFFSYLGGLALFEIAAFALTFLQGLLLFALGLVLHLFLPLVAPWRVPVDVGSSTGEEPLLKVYFIASIITLAVLCQAWLFVRYQFFPFLVVDKGFRPINALKTSSRITQTILGRLVVVDLALLGIHLLLSLLFFILIDSALLGTAFSLPLVLMVLAYLYQELAGRSLENPTPASPWTKVQRLAKRLLWFLFPAFFSMAVGVGAAHLVDRMHWVERVEEVLEEVTILVAAEDMIAGEVITEDSVTSAPGIRSLLRLGAVPEDELPTILGRRLKFSVDKGFPILRKALQPDPKEMPNDSS